MSTKRDKISTNSCTVSMQCKKQNVINKQRRSVCGFWVSSCKNLFLFSSSTKADMLDLIPTICLCVNQHRRNKQHHVWLRRWQIKIWVDLVAVIAVMNKSWSRKDNCTTLVIFFLANVCYCCAFLIVEPSIFHYIYHPIFDIYETMLDNKSPRSPTCAAPPPALPARRPPCGHGRCWVYDEGCGWEAPRGPASSETARGGSGSHRLHRWSWAGGGAGGQRTATGEEQKRGRGEDQQLRRRRLPSSNHPGRDLPRPEGVSSAGPCGLIWRTPPAAGSLADLLLLMPEQQWARRRSQTEETAPGSHMGISEEAPEQKALLQPLLLSLQSSVALLIVSEVNPDWKLCGAVYLPLLLLVLYFS